MKRILTLIFFLPVLCSAQDTPNKPKRFEVWASVGVGNRFDTKKPDYKYSEIGSYYFVNTKYTPDFSLRAGIAVNKSVHFGLSASMASMYYEHWSEGNFYGTPFLRFGLYGKYTPRFGKLSPYICGSVSLAHLPLEYPEIEGRYNGISYGADIGIKYSIVTRLAITAGAQLSYISVRKEMQSLYFYQKGVSVGLILSL